MPAGRVVAIHQPNFLPWLGFFDKLARADVFVVLDTVALPRTGGHYANHVRLLVSGKPAWITVPLRRGADARARIDGALIAENGVWRRKIISTIRQNYGKARWFATVFPVIQECLSAETDRLRDYNLTGVVAIARLLGIDPGKIVLASALPVSGQSTALLAGIVRAVGGDVYLAGGGAGGYQDDAVFAAAGVAVRPQAFAHPAYPQPTAGEFVAGLSIVDALMHCGPQAVSAMLGRDG